MGMDAYAVDRDGNRLPSEYKRGTFSYELTSPEQQRMFAGTASVLAKKCAGVDADFSAGRLGITASASAVNHLMFYLGARPDQDQSYTADSVLFVSSRITGGEIPKGLPDYVSSDKWAMEHATAFINCCAKLGLGIVISP